METQTDKVSSRPWKLSDKPEFCGKQKEGDRLIYSIETKEHIAEVYQLICKIIGTPGIGSPE